jgi:ribosomal protein S12 methylthiotransferase accessory factor
MMDVMERAVEEILDERVGIIQWLAEIPRQPDSPNLFHFAAQAANTEAFCDQWNFAVSGGASCNREVAARKAVGEAIERYCAAIYDKRSFPLCSSEMATFPVVSPEQFALFSEEQFLSKDWPYDRFDTKAKVRWTPVFDLETFTETYLPASMVYVPYFFDEDEARITQPISTGLACGSSRDAAIAGAICEVVERDAFTLMWHCSLPKPQILVETLSDANYDIVARFERSGGKVYLFNLTTNLNIPAVAAVLQDIRSAEPAMVFAAAASLSPEEAVRKALEEMAHTHRYMQELKTSMEPIVILQDHSNIVDQRTHLRFWCELENAPLAEFLFTSSQRQEFGELPTCVDSSYGQIVRELVKRIATSGLRVCVKDITTDDVSELGLTVARAVVPGANPLFMGHRFRALNGTRFQQSVAGGKLNPSPHPFP